MARLTLTFKGISLQVMPVEAGEIGIGRDPDNAMCIDSLAIAPRHAIIQAGGDGAMIRQIDPDHPVFINGQKIEEHRLQDGDRIHIGKHVLHYNDAPVISTMAEPEPRLPQSEVADDPTGTKPAHHGPEASFQVLKGKHIGVVIPIRSALTRLGKDDLGTPAVIVRRSDGYFLSALAAVDAVQINDVQIQEHSVRLNHGDIVRVNQHVLKFFCAAAG